MSTVLHFAQIGHTLVAKCAAVRLSSYLRMGVEMCTILIDDSSKAAFPRMIGTGCTAWCQCRSNLWLL